MARRRPGGRDAREVAQPAPPATEGLRLPHGGEGDPQAGVRRAVSLLGRGARRRHRARRHLRHPRRARRARGPDPRGHRDARRHLRGDGKQALDLHPDRPLQLEPQARRARRERAGRRRPLARLRGVPGRPGAGSVRHSRGEDGALGRRLHRYLHGGRDHRRCPPARDHGPRRPPLGGPRLGHGQHRGPDADRGRRHPHAPLSGRGHVPDRHPRLLFGPRGRARPCGGGLRVLRPQARCREPQAHPRRVVTYTGHDGDRDHPGRRRPAGPRGAVHDAPGPEHPPARFLAGGRRPRRHPLQPSLLQGPPRPHRAARDTAVRGLQGLYAHLHLRRRGVRVHRGGFAPHSRGAVSTRGRARDSWP